MLEQAELVVVGAGPAGATAAREAARNGTHVIVLEKDAVVGEKRVCAAGVRPGFFDTFDLPRELIHCNTTRMALFDMRGQEHVIWYGPCHTSTREELDGTIARLAREEGAEIRTSALFRSLERDGDRAVVEYADLRAGERKRIAARNVFLAQGATAKLETDPRFAFKGWNDGLLTTFQYRDYLERPAEAIAYDTLELHYYAASDGRLVVGWMFPKRDHLAIGLGVRGKMPGALLRAELDAFAERIRARLYPGIAYRRKEEGHLLYGGFPRSRFASDGMMVGGTAAGLVDATNGEGIFEAAMSGRYAAEAVRTERGRPAQAARRYARRLRGRFYGRLSHRVVLMKYLERRPARYELLFSELARSKRLVGAMERENSERTFSEKLFLTGQMLRLGLRGAFV